jgi:hypothetical protein
MFSTWNFELGALNSAFDRSTRAQVERLATDSIPATLSRQRPYDFALEKKFRTLARRLGRRRWASWQLALLVGFEDQLDVGF